MITVVEQLQQLGFTQYEAQAYITLLQRSPLNGYELAKISGIPRPNIYSVLQKLEERGAVVRLDTEEGTRYAPVASEELIQRLRNQFQVSLEAAKCSLTALNVPIEREYIWNARGYAVLIEHALTFIEKAEKQLTLAVWPQEAAALAESLERAEQRGVEVTTLCMAGCAQDCGHCHGHIHRYPVASEPDARWLVLVPDQAEVLAGEIKAGEDTLAVRTRQKMLVNLVTWYVRHSIALAALVKDMGETLNDMLSPETRDILSSIGPGDTEGGWLEHMRRLLNEGTKPI